MVGHGVHQIISGFPRSFLDASEIDENANLTWDLKSQSMKTQSFGDKKNVQLALNILQYQIEIITEDMVFDTFSLEGRTVGVIIDLIKSRLSGLQVDISFYSIELPYSLESIQFTYEYKFGSIEKPALKALSNFYHSARLSFQKTIEKELPSKYDIRIWPHHFDIAFSYHSKNEKLITVGMSPGDTSSYKTPYYYVSIWPSVNSKVTDKYQPIVGAWHNNSWSGLVLLSNDFVLENEYLEERIILDFIKNAMQIANKVAD